MSATEDDDRKHRFRFTKQDEILLLQIVLRAQPCPYKISSRDGAIMVAWNIVADEFKRESVRRVDGRLPHPRTCRTRCDKMIIDFLALKASTHIRRHPRPESVEDKLKNDLLEQLASLQGKLLLEPNGGPSGGTAEVGTGEGDANVSPSAASTAASSLGTPGSSLATPSHLLAQGTLAGNLTMGNSQLPQQHRDSTSSSTTLTPQSLANLGSSNHRTGQNQSATDLLAASALMLPQSEHHQSSSDMFSVQVTDSHSRKNKNDQQTDEAASSSRKRQAGRVTAGAGSASALAPTSMSSTPSQSGLNSLDYLQRSALASSSDQNHHSSMLPNISKRHKGSDHASIGLSSNAGASSHGQRNRAQRSNQARTSIGSMGGSVLGLSDLGDGEGSEEGGDHYDGFQDDGDDYGNDYSNDFEDDGGEENEHEEEEDEEGHRDASLLASFQGMPSLTFKRQTRSESAKRGSDRGAGGTLDSSSPRANTRTGDKFRRSSTNNQGLQRHPSGGLSKFGISSGGGYLIPSQMNEDDRAYVMRVLALEERRVKVEVDNIALERQRLALERERLHMEMRQWNNEKIK